MADLKKTEPNRNAPVALPTWPDEVYRVLKEADVRQVGMVPDAGHSRLIRAFEADPQARVITLTTDDIDSTHATLKSHGVEVDAEVSRMGDPVPPMFWFRDPDGNSLMVVEQS